MENNRRNEYVYYLPELHQIKSKVGPGLYRIQGCVSGMRKSATEDTLSPSNIKMRADISTTQFVGIRQELELTNSEVNNLKERLHCEGRNVHQEVEDARRYIHQLEMDVHTHKDKIRRLSEYLEKQRTLVRSERAKAKVNEKLIKEIKQKTLIQRPFTLYEVLFVKEDADEETIKRNYKKLASLTHPDVNGCEEQFKSIHRAYSVLSNKMARELYNLFGLERAEEDLSRQSRWSD